MNFGIKRFLLVVLLFLSPIILLVFFYIASDPFKVLYSYKNYNNSPVTLNFGNVSISNYIKNRESTHYNSFIFGSSLTMGLNCDDWKSFLPANSSIFCFYSAGESLYGMQKKIEFVAKKNDTLSNVVLLLSSEILKQTIDNERYINIQPYVLTGKTKWEFHYLFFSVFIKNAFFIKYLDYLLFRKVRPYMDGVISTKYAHFDVHTNQLSTPYAEQEIRKNPKMFYARNDWVKYPATPEFEEYECIMNEQKIILSHIKNIFSKHKTNFKILITPQYIKGKFNRKDLTFLQTLFGKENVFDFSTDTVINKKYQNFYDAFHFRPTVSKYIFNCVYAKKKVQ